jgi:serine/threonine-protein kinase
VAGGFLFAAGQNKVAVPGVIGSPVDQGRTLLEQRGFQVNVDRKASLQAVDQVIQEQPGPGSSVKKGSTINLIVSDGPPNAVVPPVEDLPLKVALAKLRTEGFKWDIFEKPDDTVKKGVVISTTPAGGEVDRVGSRVRVDVSSGIAKFPVPNVVGLDQSAAERALEDKNLVPVVVTKQSDQPEGKVFQQDPVVGTDVAAGDRVTITVSKGPASVAVPDVVGLTQADARGELQAAGFKVDVRTRPATDPADNDIVLDQRPTPATRLKKGRTVVIYVGVYTAAPQQTGTTPVPPPTTPSTTPPASGVGIG